MKKQFTCVKHDLNRPVKRVKPLLNKPCAG